MTLYPFCDGLFAAIFISVRCEAHTGVFGALWHSSPHSSVSFRFGASDELTGPSVMFLSRLIFCDGLFFTIFLKKCLHFCARSGTMKTENEKRFLL